MSRHITERHSVKPKLSCSQCTRRQGSSIAVSSLSNLIFPSYKRPHALKQHFQRVHNGNLTLAQRARRTDKDLRPTLKSIPFQLLQIFDTTVTLRPSATHANMLQHVSTTLSPHEDQHSSTRYVRRCIWHLHALVCVV